MDQIPLQVQKRAVLGKKVKALRRAGIIPANLYGHGLQSTALQVESSLLQHSLAKAGRNVLVALGIDGDNPRLAMVRDVKRDPRTHGILHVDFYEVRTTEKITAEVSLILIGEAPAVRQHNCVMLQILTRVAVQCFPQDMPSSLEVDVSALVEAEQSIQVKDIVVKPEITILADPEEVVARVMPPRLATEEEATAEAAAEKAAEAKAEGAPVGQG